MLRHPPALKVVRRSRVRENMHKEFPAGSECARHFGQQGLVVFHVLEEFDGDDAVEALGLEFIVDYIARDDA